MLHNGSRAVVSKDIGNFSLGDIVKVVGENPINHTFDIKHSNKNVTLRGVSSSYLYEVTSGVNVNNIKLENIHDI